MSRGNILITGASAGLGMGMARRFAAMGRDLALCARRTDRLDALRAELTAAYPGVRCLTYPLDVTDHDAVFEVFAAARADLGSLDRVIVNAGRSKGKPLGTGGFAANRDVVATNLVAALAQAEAALTVFREQRAGHLVLVASVAAVRGFPAGLAAYSASKSAVAVLADGLRLELAGQPIEVTTIFPGWIRSEMNAHRTRVPFIVGNEHGTRLLVRAIEREPARAFVPAWPWAPFGAVARFLPAQLFSLVCGRIYPSK